VCVYVCVRVRVCVCVCARARACACVHVQLDSARAQYKPAVAEYHRNLRNLGVGPAAEGTPKKPIAWKRLRDVPTVHVTCNRIKHVGVDGQHSDFCCCDCEVGVQPHELSKQVHMQIGWRGVTMVGDARGYVFETRDGDDQARTDTSVHNCAKAQIRT
jgi:hypothetical protein